MLIVLNNLTHHYEIEQLVRMFTKDLSVQFGTENVLKDNPTDSYIYVDKSETAVKAEICHNGTHLTETICLCDDEEQLMLDICAAVYRLCTKAFDTQLKWGMLTGVRPVRLMRNLYAKHGNIDTVCEIFKNRYSDYRRRRYRFERENFDSEIHDGHCRKNGLRRKTDYVYDEHCSQ